jgi:hypothetical protein
MAGQKARSAVFAPEVPAIHVLWRRVKRESWMPGHQGVYARLRRAMPGHDGADGCHDAFVARRLFGARSRMSRKSGYRFSEKDMRQRKIRAGSRTAAIHVHHCRLLRMVAGRLSRDRVCPAQQKFSALDFV